VSSAPSQPLKRKDFTKIHGYGTGNAKAAHRIAEDPSAVLAAVRDLKEGMLTEGSKRATKSRLKTWDSVAAKAGFRSSLSSADDMVGIIAVFNSAGYRSVASYVTDAKQRFIQAGGCWSQQHQLAYRQCLNSTSRGKGPNKGAAPFPLHLCHLLPPSASILWGQGPTDIAHPRELIIAGCWWLTREIEIAKATVSDITVTDVKADWTLSVSKSDPCALGTHRSHRCICGHGPTLASICPVHIFVQQFANLKAPPRAVGADFPLFPTKAGGVCSKAAVIAAFNTAGKLLKVGTKTHTSSDAFGGHSLRRGGIVFLASANVPREKIKIMARHSSNAVDTYLAAAADILAALAADTACDAASFLSSALAPIACPLPLKTVSEKTATDSLPATGGPNDVWVYALRPNCRVHRRNDLLPNFTLCGWHWATCKQAVCAENCESLEILGQFPEQCSKCATKLHALETEVGTSPSLSSSGSATSDSEGGE
jgi:hypothetical protein